MKVPLLDLKSQYQLIKQDILKVTEEIYDSQYFILGPHVEALEKQVAEYCHVAHALGVSSGTDALIIALMASGITAGDTVITTPYTFFATAGSICRVGARPCFVDIDPATYNISPEGISAAIEGMSPAERGHLKAILPVHLYGQCADMDPILEIARDNHLTVIEDAAQAIGAEYKGRRAGEMGDFGCFSFFPSKNLGAFGDGGMVTTPSKAFHNTLIMLRNHGSYPKYYHSLIGGNFRLDALQAAIVSVKLKHLDQWTKMRQDHAATYRGLFSQSRLEGRVMLPVEKENRHTFNQYVIRVAEKRDELRAFLIESEIGTEVYYPVPLHLQKCFSFLNYRERDFPESERAADQTLALPVYPELMAAQQEYVVDRIQFFLRK
ncbi:MAG: DegT/DnrJ/EryC1/StrS family aminotransferase [Desulfatirhabdiaceae bacterium]|nr:DegT/DnrJ/EryC1/StrS family aminotransferase [Desulfatirhabdiaceae bacterium]